MPYLSGRQVAQLGLSEIGVYNKYREYGVANADGYDWYCVLPDVNGNGDRAWVAYGPGWAALHLAYTGKAALEMEIEHLKAQLATEQLETTRLAKIVEAVREAVA